MANRIVCISTGILLFVSFYAFSYQERLYLTLWSELEPMITEEDEHPVPLETAAKRMLEEARIFFSAMIYGYHFVYTPSDSSRGVLDFFELTPIGEIPWGDPRLEILSTEKRGNRLFARLSYSMADFQVDRRKSWGSNTVALSGGKAETSLFKGQSARITSYQEAIKNAIREYARTRYFSKPRELAGEVLLWAEPYTVILAGTYTSQVTVKLRLEEYTPYRVY